MIDVSTVSDVRGSEDDHESDFELIRHVQAVKERSGESPIIEQRASASLKLPDSGVVDETV